MYILEKFYAAGFNPQQYWDNKYAQVHIAGKSSDEFRKQGFWPVMEKYLRKDQRYLDAGCGVGGWVIFLKEEGYQVEGIDPAARIVRAMTEYDRDLSVQVGSITRIPYADNTFDGLLAIGTLANIEGQVSEALKEVHRVLKPGGFVFLEVPIANVLRRLVYLPLKRIERLVKTSRGQHPTFSNYLFLPRELPAMLAKAGFKVDVMLPHELPDSNSHYGLYIDWPFLRGREPYQLNWLGLLVKRLSNAISPWLVSTGMVVVAKKN